MPLETRRVVYLAPVDDCESALLRAANAAQHSLHALCYAFTDLELIGLFIAKHQAGLDTGVVVDSTQAAGHTQRPLMQKLCDAGVPVTIARSPAGGIVHQKVLLCDVSALGALHPDSFTCLGSFNLTSTTASHQENVLITDSDGALCAYLWDEYQRVEAFGKVHCAQLSPALARVLPTCEPTPDAPRG